MEKDVSRLDEMNSNYENRKHGGPSKIYEMLSNFAKDHPNIIKENLHQIPFNVNVLPNGQKIAEGSLEEFVKAANDVMEFTKPNKEQEHSQVKAA